MERVEQIDPEALDRLAGLLAYAIGRKVADTGARPENWLDDESRARLVAQAAGEVLKQWVPRMLDPTRAAELAAALADLQGDKQ